MINTDEKLDKRLDSKDIGLLFRKYNKLEYRPMLHIKTQKLINPNKIFIPDFLFLSQTIRPKEKATKEVTSSTYPEI